MYKFLKLDDYEPDNKFQKCLTLCPTDCKFSEFQKLNIADAGGQI